MIDDQGAPKESPLAKNPAFTVKEEVQILLAEYTATRQELLSRYSALVRAISTISASILAVVAFMVTHPGILGFFVLVSIFVLLWYALNIIDIETRAAAEHLIILEQRLNAIAEKTLLTWEAENGLRAIPLGDRLKDRFAENVRSAKSLWNHIAEKSGPPIQAGLSWVRSLLRRYWDRWKPDDR